MSKSSKRVLPTVAAALLFLAVQALAQQSPAPASTPAPADTRPQGDAQGAQARQQQQRRLAVLGQLLNLTDDQKRQWMRIQREAAQNVRAARQDNSLNEAQMQQKIKEIHAEQRRQLLALLSPQQQEALKKWWEEQKQKQDQSSDGASSSGAANPPGAKDDDFFAGMVQDPDPAPAPTPAQNKKAPPKN